MEVGRDWGAAGFGTLASQELAAVRGVGRLLEVRGPLC
jgi:hypothetical protein